MSFRCFSEIMYIKAGVCVACMGLLTAQLLSQAHPYCQCNQVYK